MWSSGGNTFFNPVAYCFLYKAQDLSASLVLHNVVHHGILLGSLQNRNNKTQVSESLPHQISTESMEGFMVYTENSNYILTKTRLYHGIIKPKIRFTHQLNLKKTCETVQVKHGKVHLQS
jgi:hypothetical protein